MLGSIQKFASMLGPAIGAGLLIFFSDDAPIYASILVLFISLLPLLKVDEFPDKPKERSLTFKQFFAHWRERKNFLSSAFFAIHDSAEAVLWPIFIFVIFGTIESVSFVPIVVSITAIFFSYFTGHIRKKAREKYIVLGAMCIALVWILRIFINAEFFLYLSVFFVGLFSIVISIPLNSNMYTRAKTMGALETATYRNTTHMFSTFVLYSILAVVIYVFRVSFVIATLSLFLLIAINYYFVHRFQSKKTA